MVTLGINAFHAGASAAVVVDGRPVLAVAEERLNRIKYYAGFPRLAVQLCLKEAGLTLKDVDIVAVGRDSSANRAQKMEFALRNPSRLLNLLRIRSSRDDLNDLAGLLTRELGVPDGEARFEEARVEHHLAHIASAYYPSGWEQAAGFSCDGSGDFVTCMMADCSGGEITPKHRIYVPHSLGSLYMMVCEFIGYPRYGDEGKVMGLAPYGRNEFEKQFDDMLILEEDGIRLNADYFLPFGSNQGMSINDAGEMIVHRHYSDRMIEIFGPPRDPSAELTERDMNLAYGVQRAFEKGYMHLLRILHSRVPTERVVMAGGCALNSVANGKLLRETPFRETWIQAAAGDDGLALGAALHASRQAGDARPPIQDHAYLGPSYDDAAIEAVLGRYGDALQYERLDRGELIADATKELVAGNVLGWYQGRMEWGPRALGARSILTHPGFPGMKDILNARIKRREWFRPFAPAVLAERQSEIFEHDHPSPFMLHVFEIKPEWRERLSAVNHTDHTGRLQSVTREDNALYYDLIRSFDAATGIPVVLNTSFNENEPIVNTPEEAIECFLRTKMDALAIGSFICRKPQ
jgi:carbamoyltransferase